MIRGVRQVSVVFAVLLLSVAALAGAGPGGMRTLSSPTQSGLAAARHGGAWLGVELGPGAGPVRVEHVVRGSPADKAGLQTGDALASVDGAAVGSASDVLRAVAARAAGDDVVVLLRRAGQTRRVTVTLAVRPSADELLRMEYVGTYAPPSPR